MEKQEKKHVDCFWLHIDDDQDIFICCDARSPNHGFPLTSQQVREKACENYRPKDHGPPELELDDIEA